MRSERVHLLCNLASVLSLNVKETVMA